ncbi:MAG: thiol:disulfide interchange protein, partial [Prevotellaceae bacterium]|nr:thiol:disulfide interchange protein [Prevotellaceae bacterium]
MRKIFTLTLLLLVGIVVNAQLYNPVKFTSELKTNGTADAEIIFTGKIDKGWHVYSTNLGQEGPTEATFNVNRLEGVKLVGKMKAVGHEIAAY